MTTKLRVIGLEVILALLCMTQSYSDGLTPGVAPVSHVEITEHPKIATILMVSWRQHVAVEGGWLEFSINGGPWLASPERELERGWQDELVLGAPAEALVEVRIINRIQSHTVSSADTWTAMTGSLPVNLEEPRLLVHDPKLAHPARFVLMSLNIDPFGGFGIILNRKGRIVWYRRPLAGHEMLTPRLARSGNHILFDTVPYWSAGSDDDPIVRRETINGEIIEEIVLPYLHHAYDERPDGTIVWGYNPTGFFNEQLWAIDTTGNSWMVWDSNDWNPPGFVASNTTNWEELDDTVLMCFWTNASAVEIDFATGEILRQFGRVPGSWSFEPPESQFGFTHATNYTDDHTLLVSTHGSGGYGGEQHIREYALDDSTETLIEIWNYGEGEGLFAPTWGEAYRLDNGNTALNTGSNPLIREVTMDGEIAWSVRWPFEAERRRLGHMTYINTLAELYALDGQ